MIATLNVKELYDGSPLKEIQKFTFPWDKHIDIRIENQRHISRILVKDLCTVKHKPVINGKSYKIVNILSREQMVE